MAYHCALKHMKKAHIIMEDTNEQVEQTESTEQVEQDTTDWKAKAIEFETKYKSENAARRRYEKDLKQATSKTTETQTESKPQDKQGFDYAEKAYLKSSGIENTDFEFVKEVMDSTGKNLDQVLESKYFQAELKERKDQRMAEKATPQGSKRAGQSSNNEVEYWLAKGELPPASNRELRIKVVNARIKAEEAKSQFTDTPVVK